MKILLAVDGSEGSDIAVNAIAKSLWPDGSEIKVISVVEMLPLDFLGLPGAYFTELTGPLESIIKPLLCVAGETVPEGRRTRV